MLPAINIPDIVLFGVVFKPFHMLILAAVVGGHFLGLRRARKVGLDAELMRDGNIWTMAIGFVVAHLVALVFYHPEKVLEDPLVILALWNGLSSYGGLIGAFLGAKWYYKRNGSAMLYYADTMIFGFVPVWMLGRLGCTITFDHPGTPTSFFLGMSDKTGMPSGHFGLYSGGTVRHNLGFYELLLTAALTAVLYATGDYRPFDLFHCALMLLIYCPVRFYMDSLRVRDKLYLGLTTAQYISIAGVLLALWLMWYGRKYHSPGQGAELVESKTENKKQKLGNEK